MADQSLKNLTNSNAKRLSSSQTFSEIASPIRNMSSTSNSRTSIVTLLLPTNTNERINSSTDKIFYFDNQKRQAIIPNMKFWYFNFPICFYKTNANCVRPLIALNHRRQQPAKITTD